jgi:uncharacterized protein (TIGR02679 family)
MANGVDEIRLRRLLGGDHTAWLLDRIRRRLELGRPVTGAVTLTGATLEQRRAVERLLGRRAGTGTSLTVSLDDVDAVVRASGAAPDGLVAAVRVLLGEVADRSAAEAEESAAWSAACAPLDGLAARRPELTTWRAWLDATGMVRRMASTPADATALVEALVRVLDALPSTGLPLGRLAATATGDAHALDDGRPLSTLSLGAVRVLAGAAPAGHGSASERRAAWAAVGVHLDELSSSVLCVGLPGGTATAVERMVAIAREAGEPCVLTLRQLGQDHLDLGAGAGLVRVCENPIVLACAADELGPECPPLVCLSGHPSAAALRLLTMSATGGAHFAYHGDFDWGGIRIANALRERFGWKPWRFDARAYRSALASVTGGPLTGRPVDAAWDLDLRPTLEQHGVHIQEELVLPDLMNDLADRVP